MTDPQAEALAAADAADPLAWALEHADERIAGIVYPWELAYATRMRSRLAALANQPSADAAPDEGINWPAPRVTRRPDERDAALLALRGARNEIEREEEATIHSPYLTGQRAGLRQALRHLDNAHTAQAAADAEARIREDEAQKWRSYARHDYRCDALNMTARPCTCGLAALLARSEPEGGKS